MASTIQGDLISDVYRLMTENLVPLWQREAVEIMLATLDPNNIDASSTAYLQRLVRQASLMSASYAAISSNFLEMYLLAEGVESTRSMMAGAGTASVLSVVEFDKAAFVKRMYGAGVAGYKQKLNNAGLVQGKLPEDNEFFIQSINNAAGDFTQHVLKAGRETIIEEVKANPKILGVGRNPSSNACPFCLMLATRANYRTEESASFKAHRNCKCSPEPRTEGWSPTQESLDGYQKYLAKEERLNNELGKGFRDAEKRARKEARDVAAGKTTEEKVELLNRERWVRDAEKKVESNFKSGKIDDDRYMKTKQSLETKKIDNSLARKEQKYREDRDNGLISDAEYEEKRIVAETQAAQKKQKLKPEGELPKVSKTDVKNALLGK